VIGSGTAQETDEFARRLIDIANSGMLALMISVGLRTGLFETMESLPPSTSSEIAAAAGLDERYVREWLAAVATGGIVVHDPANMTFVLPSTYAAAMKRLIGGPGGPRIAWLAQDVSVVARLEDGVIDCFKHGGGQPYEALWSAFGAQLAATSDAPGPLEDEALLEGALPLVPQVVERLRSGIDVADVGCGSGRQLNVMAQRFPASRFVGFDFYADDWLEEGRAQARQNGLTNVRFEKKDAATLDGSEMFDFITTFDAVHDQARPDLVLRGIAESLRPGGVYLCVDISGSSILADNLSDPVATIKYTWSVMHCMSVSLAYGGMGLGTVWGEQLARQMITEAGFASVETLRLPGDLFNCYHIATKA
jgi:2-polyprenyl-3-methyl-5-hydroxy-6-metoxy-1,4-benzoquinol methylase